MRGSENKRHWGCGEGRFILWGLFISPLWHPDNPNQEPNGVQLFSNIDQMVVSHWINLTVSNEIMKHAHLVPILLLPALIMWTWKILETIWSMDNIIWKWFGVWASPLSGNKPGFQKNKNHKIFLVYFLMKRHGFQAGFYYRAIVWINRLNINNSIQI